MSPWQRCLEEQLCGTARMDEVLGITSKAAHDLNFEYCGYLSSTLLPCAQPKVISISNFPAAWQHWYQQAGVLRSDPVVAHCRRTDQALVWRESIFASTPEIWTRAKAYGLCGAWSQGVSVRSVLGTRGMFTLARGASAITDEEIRGREQRMSFLAKLTHEAMLRVTRATADDQAPPNLSARENEILRWTGDGKTIAEIAIILSLSENTIKFHIKNSMAKLKTNNKTAAAFKAALLGLLH